MAKKIINAPRIDNKVYAVGSEDELAKALTAEQDKTLTEQGSIEGFDELPKTAEKKK